MFRHSLFLSAMRSADNRTWFVRQSQRVKRLTFYEQDNRSDLGASSEFFGKRERQKRGCNPCLAEHNQEWLAVPCIVLQT